MKRKPNKVKAEPAEQVFKVQIDADGRSALIYSEDRNVMFETGDRNFIDDLMELFDMGALSKRYIVGKVLENGVLMLSHAAPNNHDW